MRILYLFIFCFFIISCSIQKRELQQDQVLLDSLKWLMYAVNYGYAVDSVNPDEPGLNILQSNIRLSSTDTVKDAIEYRFTFSSPNSTFEQYSITGLIGFGVKEKYIYPLIWHAANDVDSNPDSYNIFFRELSKKFSDHLKTYKGEINPWLKTEAKRRGILN